LDGNNKGIIGFTYENTEERTNAWWKTITGTIQNLSFYAPRVEPATSALGTAFLATVNSGVLKNINVHSLKWKVDGPGSGFVSKNFGTIHRLKWHGDMSVTTGVATIANINNGLMEWVEVNGEMRCLANCSAIS